MKIGRGDAGPRAREIGCAAKSLFLGCDARKKEEREKKGFDFDWQWQLGNSV